MPRRTRSGFTLFQLLVLVAILGFLLALLLPAIARVRAAAARVASQNNLKQIALAAHSYHDANKRLPPGCDGRDFSAHAYLLPYIEQENVFRQINFNAALDAKDNEAARKTRIKVFESPQDPLPLEGNFGPTNYLFSAGSKPDLKDNDGVCYLDSRITLAAIPDGTSNTLLTGETLRGDGGTKAVDVRRQHVHLAAAALKGLKLGAGVDDWKAGRNIAGNRGASWMDGRFLQGTFTGTRAVNDARPDVDCGGAGGLSGLRSLPPAPGVNVALCDGSVRYVSAQVPVDTWRLLASRNDGQVIPNID